MSDPVVSTEWLADHLEAPDLIVLDASWHLPTANRDAKAEYLAEHVPGALFFDIDEIADIDSPLPHMLPSPEKFSSRMRRMGIGDGKRIVVYDSVGLFSAARVWWMFRYFGHGDVAILDGGLKKWKAEGRPLEDGPPRRLQERHFTARVQSMMLADKGEVEQAIAGKSSQLADARSAPRFTGAEKEPRAGVRSGHMPGAHNVHYGSLLNPDGTLKDREEIRKIFEARGVDLSKPVITTCGSGVTAAILTLGLTQLGHNRHALYDGSWAEWGLEGPTPVVTGE